MGVHDHPYTLLLPSRVPVPKPCDGDDARLDTTCVPTLDRLVLYLAGPSVMVWTQNEPFSRFPVPWLYPCWLPFLESGTLCSRGSTEPSARRHITTEMDCENRKNGCCRVLPESRGRGVCCGSWTLCMLPNTAGSTRQGGLPLACSAHARNVPQHLFSAQYSASRDWLQCMLPTNE